MKNTMKIRTYSELIRIPTFLERFEYLKLHGVVGADTFGPDRYLNQRLYHSATWDNIKRKVILRDNGLDLGIPGREIHGRVVIHHMNPISAEDILIGSDLLFDPEYLISVSLRTHNAIHYGDKNLLIPDFSERKPNDTCPWKIGKEV